MFVSPPTNPKNVAGSGVRLLQAFFSRNRRRQQAGSLEPALEPSAQNQVGIRFPAP
jgi:hypothetical protein